jgi:endonuclease/exonuclease/phosphatase family metal-dependent hydrolase
MKEITVASYNVHRCIGTDRVHDPARIVAVLRELEADIVALQEVSSQRDVGRVDQATYLAEKAERFVVEGPTLRRGQRSYGNVLLSRWRPVAVRCVDLSLSNREPRGAIDADIDVESRVIRFVATHFGLRRMERRRQVRSLLEAIAGQRRSFCILAGDFNEWLPGSQSLRAFDQCFGAAPRLRTFPSNRPTFALDRIWVQPSAALTDITVHATPLARVASDHLPIRARIALSDGGDEPSDPETSGFDAGVRRHEAS